MRYRHRWTQMNTDKKKSARGFIRVNAPNYLCPSVFICGEFLHFGEFGEMTYNRFAQGVCRFRVSIRTSGSPFKESQSSCVTRP